MISKEENYTLGGVWIVFAVSFESRQAIVGMERGAVNSCRRRQYYYRFITM